MWVSKLSEYYEAYDNASTLLKEAKEHRDCLSEADWYEQYGICPSWDACADEDVYEDWLKEQITFVQR